MKKQNLSQWFADVNTHIIHDVSKLIAKELRTQDGATFEYRIYQSPYQSRSFHHILIPITLPTEYEFVEVVKCDSDVSTFFPTSIEFLRAGPSEGMYTLRIDCDMINDHTDSVVWEIKPVSPKSQMIFVDCDELSETLEFIEITHDLPEPAIFFYGEHDESPCILVGDWGVFLLKNGGDYSNTFVSADTERMDAIIDNWRKDHGYPATFDRIFKKCRTGEYAAFVIV